MPSSTASTYSAGSCRIDTLSHPKPIPAEFQEDRRSVYWVDKRPIQPGPDGTTEFAMTERLATLSLPKSSFLQYQGDRPTSMWPVSDGAKEASASARVKQLAEHKEVHNDFHYDSSVYTQITPHALNAEPTGRMKQLSKPKPHKIWANSFDTISYGDFCEPLTPVDPSALESNCSTRLATLASPKNPNQDYQPMRPVEWPVSDNAKKASATLRLQQLSRPKSANMKKDDYDPYRVSFSARNAKPAPRINELCEPIPRKVRQKKAS